MIRRQCAWCCTWTAMEARQRYCSRTCRNHAQVITVPDEVRQQRARAMITASVAARKRRALAKVEGLTVWQAYTLGWKRGYGLGYRRGERRQAA